MLAGKLSPKRAALNPEGLRVRRGVRSSWTLASLGREAAVTGAATGPGCEPGWAGALQLPGPGLWGRQMLRGLSQPPRPQLCCKSTPSEGLQPCPVCIGHRSHIASPRTLCDPPALAIPVLGLLACTTTSGCLIVFNRFVEPWPPSLLHARARYPTFFGLWLTKNRVKGSHGEPACSLQASAYYRTLPKLGLHSLLATS